MLEDSKVKGHFPRLDNLSIVVINIPLINVISGFSVQMMGRDAMHFGNLRALIFFIIIVFVLKVFGINERITRRLILFMAYLFVLILFSSNFMYSFTDTYLKVLVSMLMFPVGFFVLNDYNKMVLFLKNFVYAALLLCINYIFAQIFSIGRSVYLDDSFYYGYAGIGSTVVLSYLLLTVPLLKGAFKTWLGSLIFKVVIFLSILFTIIALKRIAIIALFVGYIIYMFQTKSIKKGLKNIGIILIFLFITAPLYFDVFKQRLEVRPTEINELDEEQRYFDIMIAFQDFKTKGVKHALIGTEPFNTPGYFGRTRQVHVDYANLLIGTGLIGLLIYLWIYFSIYNKFRKLYIVIRKNQLYVNESNFNYLKDLKGVFTAVLVASLIVSLSGGLHVITTRSILFTLLGGLLGIIYKYYNYYRVKILNSFKP